LWPLGLFFLLAIVAGVLVWQYWPRLMMHSIVWQRSVNLEMSALLKRVAENPRQAG
ncbi:MAG TPA: nickel transporter, partial [Enterobacteriaceae bacterium]|nr:nickel transporter [Enterobacteriaceae bacterium]